MFEVQSDSRTELQSSVIHNVLQMLACQNAFHICYAAGCARAFIIFLSAD